MAVDRSRRENSAEHSWHIALTVMILSEYAGDEGIDLFRVMKILLVHDLIEIDAASNRGIDEIRDIREKVGFRPNEGRFKVYVLDEATNRWLPRGEIAGLFLPNCQPIKMADGNWIMAGRAASRRARRPGVLP